MFRVRGLGLGVQGLDLLVRVGPSRYEQLPDLVGTLDHLRSGLTDSQGLDCLIWGVCIRCTVLYGVYVFVALSYMGRMYSLECLIWGVWVGPSRYEQLPDLVGSFDHLRSGLRFEGSGFRVQGAGSGLRVAGLGFGGLRLRV